MSNVAATTLCGALILLTSAELRTNAAQQPAFDVVSVKPNVSGDERSASYVQPGGRYTASNVTLRMLIKTAYQVHDDQIVGGPDWMETARFDVNGKAADTTPTAMAFIDLARLMLRRALEDRFNLTLVRGCPYLSRRVRPNQTHRARAIRDSRARDISGREPSSSPRS